jgi:small subunit ribosomal protein S6
MAIYEAIFIMDSLVPPKDIEVAVERFNGIITENGGTVRKVDKWGKKRMSYEIEKKQYGFYVSIEFEGTGNIPALLENDFNFNDKVLRYLVYRYNKNKLKVLKLKEQDKKEPAAPPPPKPEPAPQKQEKPEPKPEPADVSQPGEPAESSEESAERGE